MGRTEDYTAKLLNRIDKYGWSLEDALTRPRVHALIRRIYI